MTEQEIIDAVTEKLTGSGYYHVIGACIFRSRDGALVAYEASTEIARQKCARWNFHVLHRAAVEAAET
jgi:hypothetical protein